MRYDDGIVERTEPDAGYVAWVTANADEIWGRELVTCVATGETMTIADAARRYRTGPHEIRRAIENGGKTGKHRWAWKDQPPAPPLRRCRAVVSDRGERWPGGTVEAAKALGRGGPSTISAAIHGGYLCRGRRLWFEGQRPRPAVPARCKPVIRVEDSTPFPSVSAVLAGVTDALAFKREFKALSRAIDDRKPYKGFHYIHPSKQMLAYLAGAATVPQAGVA